MLPASAADRRNRHDVLRKGFFLSFEGLDGSGKSTQLRLLADVLRSRGLPVAEMRQPGGTDFGNRVRALLLESRNEAPIAPLAELAMMFADRAQAIVELVQPALERGDVLLCDRWTDSTEAYQGGGRMLGEALVRGLHRELCGSLNPELTLLLLPPIEVSLARARRRNAHHHTQTGRGESRFEAESEAFFRRTYAQYQVIAAREPVRVVVIDADESIETIHARIVQLVEARLSGWQQAP